MDYIGEHLLPGQLGQFFITLSLVASLVATFAYFRSTILSSEIKINKWIGWIAIFVFFIAANCIYFYLVWPINLKIFNNSFIDTTLSIILKIAVYGTWALFFFYMTKKEKKEDSAFWKKLARFAFITEVISVFAIFGVLFYIIQGHFFEYKYAWQHSSRSLEPKYLLACFWEGQEGSFLLWSIWHCVLGLILIKTAKKWEAPVMTVVSLAQVCLATMIAGIYIFDWKMGSNPFILLRDSGVLDNAPALHLNFDIHQPLKADYMLFIKDGNDLNVLLQNYWMVIHPPVLFLGFASTIIPFAYAIAGLWTKNFGEWTKSALPWALFSAAALGIGIMMGAAWAYESLTFGGYWAWDPVENASLVPWLILIAGIHTLLIYKHSGHSLRTTHLFFILCFGFILYSTFLTRSGILGESSVHAFTDLGMNVQLFSFMYLFIWLGGIIGAKNNRDKFIAFITAVLLAAITYKFNLPWFGLIALLTGIGFTVYNIQTQVPTIKKEEEGSSREFWMFIGSLVFFLSAIVIIAKTSLPVVNKLFGTNLAPAEDPEFSYNQIQIFVAIIIAVLTGFAQYLKYKSTPLKFFWKKMWLPALIAVVIASLVIAFGDINYDKKGIMFLGAIWLAIACSIYTAVANAAYIWLGLKGKLKLSGGSIAHFGFGLVLLGILISSSGKEMLSKNTSGIFINFGKDSDQDPGENLTMVKGIKNDMGKYWVTYEKNEKHPKKEKWAYDIRFLKKDSTEEFVLRPTAFVNVKGNEGIQPEPDSRHYWDHDVFTYITALPAPEKNKDTATFRTKNMKPGDSLFYSKGFLIMENININDKVPKEIFGEDGKLYETPFKIYTRRGSLYTVTPKLAYAKGGYLGVPDTITSESLVLQLQKVNPDNSIEVGIKESDAVMDYITLKAYKFPFINILWAGIIITAIGILVSMVHRIRLNLNSKP